jgi:predicted nucleotidyltransferase
MAAPPVRRERAMSLTDTNTKTVADRLPVGLLERIVAHLNPIKVIVFGSQATGNTHRDSDWDLLIVVDDDIPTERINWRGIHEARKGIRGAIDLIPCRESTFLDRKDIVGSLPWTALNEGVAVYERSKAA